MKARDVSLLALGAVVGAVITWTLGQPQRGESFPIVFRGRTQAVTSDGDGVAFYRHQRYTETFHAFPAFEVRGQNRTQVVPAEVCLAPGTAEQDVVFAVVNLEGMYSLAWYECLTEGVALDWAPSSTTRLFGT